MMVRCHVVVRECEQAVIDGLERERETSQTRKREEHRTEYVLVLQGKVLVVALDFALFSLFQRQRGAF
jgi:hypothetical protein